MGVVKQDVGVVKPGVGVVKTEVEANGEEEEKAAPISISEGEDLTCPLLSVAMEDLKWQPSMVEDLSVEYKSKNSN